MRVSYGNGNWFSPPELPLEKSGWLENLKTTQTTNGANILVLGLTFKENCPDIRNSKVFDILNTFLFFSIFIFTNLDVLL